MPPNFPSFPITRPRRLRTSPLLRRLVRETHLHPSDFILPLFVRPGRGVKQPITSMPGNFQLSPDTLVEEIGAAAETGVTSFMLFGIDDPEGRRGIDYAQWRERMQGYAASGYAFDLEENEDQIRCVAAPIRDAGGKIVGALSVSSAAQYMTHDRMQALSGEVLATAHAISADLGWSGGDAARKDTRK